VKKISVENSWVTTHWPLFDNKIDVVRKRVPCDLDPVLMMYPLQKWHEILKSDIVCNDERLIDPSWIDP
jgi:hypothetical protein